MKPIYDTEAVQKQIDQHQSVVDNLKEQKIGIDNSINKLLEEINKLKKILEN